MTYKHYIFLSYRRYELWPQWVENNFMPLFRHHLGEELGEAPKIFYDIASIEPGVSWPKKIGEALAKSCILVPLFSKQYFTSEWCKRELCSMLAREKALGFNTAAQPERLIVPARIHDGHDFPEYIKDIQCARLENHSNVRVAKNSMKHEELEELIKAWIPSVARAIERVPPYDESWRQLEVDHFMNTFKQQQPKQRKLPRLG